MSRQDTLDNTGVNDGINSGSSCDDLKILLSQFSECAAKKIEATYLGSFVNAEAICDKFISENQDLIKKLSEQDRKNFVDNLIKIFISSIKDSFSSPNILDNNTTNSNLETTNSSPLVNNNNNSNESVHQTNNKLNQASQNNNKKMFCLHRPTIFKINGCQNNLNQGKLNTKTMSWFGKIRYFLYKFTSISANSGRISFSLVCSMIYNIIILGMVLSSLTPIIATIAHIGWTKNEIDLRNYYINKYRLYMFAFAWFLLLDWIIRFSYADFSNPYVSTKKAFLSYFFNLSNLYQLGSVIAVITLLFIYGSNWGIDLDEDNDKITKQVVTILFLLNVAVVIPRFVENFFFGKNLIILKKILKSKWKILLSAGIVLLILLLIFAFTIFETENTYYIQQGWLNPQTGKYDLNAFTHGEPFETIWEALWYCFITITTIGYGDYVPYSAAGKIIAVFLAVVGISYFTFIMGILVNIFTDYSTLKKSEENKLKDTQEKNNQFKQFNYLYDLIINNFEKIGLIDNQKATSLRIQENKQINKASDVLDEISINERGHLQWNNTALGNRVYNNKEIKQVENLCLKPISEPNLETNNNLVYSLDDLYLRRIFRYKHFAVLLTKVLGTTNINNIFICKEHYNRGVYGCLNIATSVVMPKQLAFDAYSSFSQFENKLQFDAYFRNDDCIQINLINKIYLFPKINRLSQYGLEPRDFIIYKFLS